MGFLKKYRRLSVLLSLLIGTLILYGIDLIVSNMLNVFLVALASWTVYCIEYLVAMGFDKEKRLEEKEKLLKEKREQLSSPFFIFPYHQVILSSIYSFESF